jgi:hypothetical protein
LREIDRDRISSENQLCIITAVGKQWKGLDDREGVFTVLDFSKRFFQMCMENGSQRQEWRKAVQDCHHGERLS